MRFFPAENSMRGKKRQLIIVITGTDRSGPLGVKRCRDLTQDQFSYSSVLSRSTRACRQLGLFVLKTAVPRV